LQILREGATAVVHDGGEPTGRAIALALAARGVRVVVAGANERALGETVGEIAFGGGKARHVVGGVEDGVRRAEMVFAPVEVAFDVKEDGGVLVTAGGKGAKALPAAGRDPEETARLVVEACFVR